MEYAKIRIEDMLEPRMRFKGVFSELPKSGNVGDLCIVNGENYMFNAGAWENVCYENVCYWKDEQISYSKKPTHCKGCGAPLIPYKSKCEYCGSYWK